MRRLFITLACILSFQVSANYLVETSSIQDFPLVTQQKVAPIVLESSAEKGVLRAVENLRSDIAAVTGQVAKIYNELPANADAIVLIGQLGKSDLIQQLIDQGKLDVHAIQGKWDGYHIQHLRSPFKGIDNAWVIVGNDKRGAIYGTYDLSQTIGVSPWYWWADVPVKKKTELYLSANTRIADYPKVKYRGIFLNDEAPALTGWSTEKFGGYNAEFYQHVFELLLRLKANFLWPAMWNNAFADDDPQNIILANEMGIVMSTSHHEPMMRADKEWNRYGKGPWEYSTNPKNLYDFWLQGAKRHKNLESIFTLGMRGQEDTPMSEGENIGLLERVVEDQRQILKDTFGQDKIEDIPQVWALYKEVQSFYEKGMRVPDDVTLLWADDNFGNVRRLPTKNERNRKGGAGIYYHFDYVGGPRSYRWINTVPLAKIWEQMDLAYRYGADRIWITNVGDLKPMELPISFFLKMAWDPTQMDATSSYQFTRKWAAQQFGETYANEIADLLDVYTQHNGRRKPEAVTPETYSISNYDEAKNISTKLTEAVEKSNNIQQQLPQAFYPAYFQLVGYPLKASRVIFELNYNQALNKRYAKQNRITTNQTADAVNYWFQQDQALTDEYHNVKNGRWNKMMSQPHIGYVHWRNPPANIPPTVVRHTAASPEVADMGVAISSSDKFWPAVEFSGDALKLDTFYSHGKQSREITVFNRQSKPFSFTATASADWIRLSSTEGIVEEDINLSLSIDWSKLAEGTHNANVMIKGTGWGGARVYVQAIKLAQKPSGFAEADGYISLNPAQADFINNTANAKWQVIPGHGRFGNSVAGILPPYSQQSNWETAPRLNFDTWFLAPGDYEVHIDVAPSLDFAPNSTMEFGLGLNGKPPKYLNAGLMTESEAQALANKAAQGDILAAEELAQKPRQWSDNVLDGIRRVKTKISIAQGGANSLQLYLKDPGVVVQKIVIYTSDYKPSYLGPEFTQYLE